MTPDNMLPNLILPFEENEGSFSLDATAFVARLLLYTTHIRAMAIRDGAIFANARTFLNSTLHDTVLSHAPLNLHQAVRDAVLPALDSIMNSNQPQHTANAIDACDGLLKGYAIALGGELKKQIIIPNFRNIPRQPSAPKTFYMGLPENFFVARTKNPYYGAASQIEGPSDAWNRQINEAIGWLALRDLLKHVGAQVTVLEPDADVLSLTVNFGDHTPYSKLKFTRDRGLIVGDTIYMERPYSILDSGNPLSGSGPVTSNLGNNFRKQLKNDGYRFQEVDFGISGGNIIYDDVKDVLFVGGIVTTRSDLMILAAKEWAMPRPTAKTLVIAVPLIDPGNIDLKREVRVKADAQVVEQAGDPIQFYDLDTMLSVVDGKVALYAPATSSSTLDRITRVYGAENVSCLTDRMAARAYALNSIPVGDIVISPFANDEVRAIFGKSGKEVVTPEDIGLPAGSFCFSEGAARCMTNASIARPLHL